VSLKNFAAFGFIVAILLAVGLTFVAATPMGLPKGVSVALMIGMMVATWMAIGTAIAFFVADDAPRRYEQTDVRPR
jgi:hypothetical protein